jgi:hypothetical protein
MKKVKIMLLSLALFAVVGGALAFKAKFSESYCKTATIQVAGGGFACAANPGACQLINNSTTIFELPAQTTYCYTLLPVGQINCAGVVDCKESTTFRVNQ